MKMTFQIALLMFGCFSAKRKEEYKDFQLFTDVDSLKILKHVSTRWLSLENCVNRFLNQWSALQSYFDSHVDSEKPGKIKRCAERLKDPCMKLHYHFLAYALHRLNKFNTELQVN